MSAARLVNHSKFIGFIKIHKGPKTCGWAYGELFAIFNDIIIKVVYIKDEKKRVKKKHFRKWNRWSKNIKKQILVRVENFKKIAIKIKLSKL